MSDISGATTAPRHKTDGGIQDVPERSPHKGTGILPCQAIQKMVENREIFPTQEFLMNNEIDPTQIQPASIDLRLGVFAYPVDASFLPRDMSVLQKLQQLDEKYDSFKIDLRNGAVLEKGRVYVIPLLEEIDLKSEVSGFANPKSSTGRLDILTRLITDGGTDFDEVKKGYKGKLYVEVVPRTFSVVVKTGARLNQLRFSRARGATPSAIPPLEWKRLLDEKQIVQTEDTERKLSEEKGMLRFTVDLRGSGEDGAIIGYRAKKHTNRIDLEKRDYDPLDFWEPIRFHKTPSFVLAPDEFYILMTKEPVAVPPEYAAEMVAYDTAVGEFRVHYAGFFDPGFGWNASTGAGSSRGVLEVRSHGVPFLLEHGQVVGLLRYERMAARPEKLYGQEGIGSNYQGQGLKLAKQFRPLE